MPDDRLFPLAIGFLGAGQMATALAGGWIKAGLLDTTRSRAADPFAEARAKFEKATAIGTLNGNRDVAEACDLLILAVKPQVLPTVLEELRPALHARHLVISIAAGVTLQALTDSLGSTVRLIRVMPNTPCLVGASATGYSPGGAATPDDVELVGKLFGAVGKAYRVSEPLLDTVTGLSGSGPAYVYMLIEAMADGGVRCGLPRDVSISLAAQTVFGAAKMILETGQHPAILKDAVTSPGGTTIAGLQVLERSAFRAATIDAIEAATNRAKELGKKQP
jgi:pyrroline-5-carboxylate reductase